MSIKATHDLKTMESRIKQKQLELDAAKLELKNVQKKVSDCERELHDLNNKISVFKRSQAEPTITEHALLRYFERVKGYDLEAISLEILPPETVKQIKLLNSGKFPRDGYKLVVKNNVVVTIED